MADNKGIDKLVFIYNADSGISNALIDSVHKIISPSTYNCNLCDITFGVMGEKADWKLFRETFGMEMVFLHRDELQNEGIEAMSESLTYPIVLSRKEDVFETFINTAELNELPNMSSLIDIIKKGWQLPKTRRADQLLC